MPYTLDDIIKDNKHSVNLLSIVADNFLEAVFIVSFIMLFSILLHFTKNPIICLFKKDSKPIYKQLYNDKRFVECVQENCEQKGQIYNTLHQYIGSKKNITLEDHIGLGLEKGSKK